MAAGADPGARVLREVRSVVTRRVMRSVLRGFLGTYTSRYSDYRGYWLHGQLPKDIVQCTIDLLRAESDPGTAVDAACRLATRRFAEQLSKTGLARDVVREATLQIARIPGAVEGYQGGQLVDGEMMRFSARAVMDNGRVFQAERAVFVAPHDPRKEHRRVEADWGA